mmetsp:Transcript_36355/g.102433  ORF Transcript_36355/g.102433 Transcript_36355/m.102433 type:complete len:149 (+) Transcript_36355:121-567(+)|eukprot:CAMPEP_0119126496 /NCGR_PEP_ID=MMETSP1310-20130426/5404_1 /TAXON_ID=464262 /ORGANISM="Genus nov. species nov., Strain RCC2339" /LENGTH=148 /DNA_ID=CAMNT_0007116659 /DNA_START=66 /DNA_END=512 /DNA_ORIENTATION=+
MPKFTLNLKADLENLAELIPDEDTRWYLKFRCTHCNEETGKFVYVSKQEEVQHGRGKFNLLYRCSLCKREHTVDVVSTLSYSSSGQYAPVAVFECRGLEPIEYDPRVGWTARAESGRTFECDLADDFADYDDDANEPVSVYSIESKFS